MPPRAKFSKEDIVSAAIKIIREQGLEKLTARNLAETLNVSTKPIFVAFKNMDEVVLECRAEAVKIYNEYKPDIENGYLYSAEKYIHFSKDEPNLFKFRYLQDNQLCSNFEDLMYKLDSNFNDSVKMIQEAANCDEPKGRKIYGDVWLFSHGIASLCAFNQCSFSYQEIHEELLLLVEKITA